jgi:flagellin-like protein
LRLGGKAALRNRKKAISEVVGALMMITITVVSGLIVYIYASGTLGALQAVQVQQPYLEQVSLDYYSWNLSNGNLNLTVINVGGTNLKFVAFYIASNPVTPTYYGCTGSLNVKTSCRIGLHYTGLTFSQGIAYNVRAVTSDGAIFNFSCIAGATS